MPTYQYACNSCGENLEVVQKFTDDALTECPACHGPLHKVFSAVGVVFKGSGFYRTDSRDSGRKGSSGSGSGSSASSGSNGSESGSGSGSGSSSADSGSSSSTSGSDGSSSSGTNGSSSSQKVGSGSSAA